MLRAGSVKEMGTRIKKRQLRWIEVICNLLNFNCFIACLHVKDSQNPWRNKKFCLISSEGSIEKPKLV